MEKRITAPLTPKTARGLACGDRILLSGAIIAARDAAHKRMTEELGAGGALPFPPEGAVIYYMGPTPTAPGRIFGSAGPTTSGRMDIYAPRLLRLGILGMIGKGNRGEEVVESMKLAGAVYFGAIGGAGALMGRCVKSAAVIAYEDLGAEAVYRLEVEDMPLVVAIDAMGANLYERGRADYLAARRGTVKSENIK